MYTPLDLTQPGLRFIKADPPQPVWTWDTTSRRYREAKTGRYIGAKQMLALRDTYTDRQKLRTDALARQLVDGDITIQQWTLAMREAVKETYLSQYAMAIGGRQTMTQRDFGIIGRALRDQYEYLQKFATDIQTGKYTGANLDGILKRMQVRAGMYIESGTEMYERAKGEALGVPRLPHYPGDGSTACLTNCRCSLDWQQVANGWDVMWRLDKAAENCEDCQDRDKKVIRVRNGAIENPKAWD